MHALVRFANIAAGSTFTTADLYLPALDALGLPHSQYSLASLRYDLSKLRAKGLLEKLPHSRRYRREQGLFHLRALPEAIRAHLCPTHRGSPPAFSKRSSPRPGQTLST
jgi:hypothetical protein